MSVKTRREILEQPSVRIFYMFSILGEIVRATMSCPKKVFLGAHLEKIYRETRYCIDQRKFGSELVMRFIAVIYKNMIGKLCALLQFQTL